MTTSERLFDATRAFDNPFTVGAVVAIVIGLLTTSFLIRVLHNAKWVADDTYAELLLRTRSWYVLTVALFGPILLGAAWVDIFLLALSVFCFREYANATGLKFSRSVTIPAYLTILLIFLACLDNFYDLFTCSWILGICLIAVVSLTPDRPDGYIRRTSLAIVGIALFGVSLGHLAFFSNDVLFRPLLIWILICTELNDVFAFLSGKSFGKRKMLPKTSPNKTWAGSIGAVVLTTILAVSTGRLVFAGTGLDQIVHLLLMGLLISIFGQCGDLLVSSIKRDLGIKDMAAVIPGHGGLLDRFDSSLLVAPALFHYINYFKPDGVGGGQATRIITSQLPF